MGFLSLRSPFLEHCKMFNWSKMIRTKQKLMLLVLGIMCTTLFVTLRKDYPKEFTDILNSDLNRIEAIMSNSKMFTSAKQYSSSEKTLSTRPYATEEGGNELLFKAKRISRYNKTVLFTVINDAYLKFTYSWLCNSKNMGIHKSVLIVTTDQACKENLTRDWPDISVVSIGIILHGDQRYGNVGYVKIMVKRTEIILALLMADIEVFLFEVDCVWLANPVPNLQKIRGHDILVNPVARTNNKIFAGGFLWLYATERAKALWMKLTEEMVALDEKISKDSDNTRIPKRENDQRFFSKLIRERYKEVIIKILPLDLFADGQWYSLPEDIREKSRPLIINNNWILGNEEKISRAKKWKHWFIDDYLKCDMDLVSRTVYT